MIEIALFIAALFIAPWLIDALVAPPGDTLQSFLTAFIPRVWSPTILAIGFVTTRGGLAALRLELGARLSYRRGSIWWLVLAVAVPTLAVAGAVISARAAGAGAPFVPSSALLQVIGIQIVTGAVGEELGWRGFLLSRLGPRAGMLPAAWIMGLLWALWHVPAFFDPNLPHRFMPMGLVLPFIVFFGAFMGLLFNQVGGSILVTISAHLSLNIAMALGGASFSSWLYWGVLATLFGVLAIVMTLRVRGAALRNEGQVSGSLWRKVRVQRSPGRHRSHWTAPSWRRYLATCAIPVGAVAVVACLLIALDLQLVGEPRSVIRGLCAVISAVFLVVGAIGLVVVIRPLNEGEPSRPFIGPRALLARPAGPASSISCA
jgi:uncharacterized protein